jgi:hypothetical protein
MVSILATLFCNHDYNLVNHFEIPSEVDICVSHHYRPNSWHNIKRQYVSDYKCTKCGNLKRLKAKTI